MVTPSAEELLEASQGPVSIRVRTQAAFVRSLLDELAHYLADATEAISLQAQLTDETEILSRLLDDEGSKKLAQLPT